ncbi:ABC transporter permease [Amycolatopsis rubida]|uniref:ABC transporter permease n=1 Tax=Amycolatopsis rubida TaxID=112413 RepID=A0A1I5FAS1_9PSEU|nr:MULTISPECIES: ABC transporter permease [Amycolatopsis]MYW91817.1 ABC transporter permease [Amycolatopsis rubida]NEC56802.1 ABC transporter permease [Amycolatopsis rubida]OAP28030.1 ABC-2 family transporter protein [Amycolatopsis sp. M39]SFO20780.1 ABC-2 type transport system permease protein [Amycolatopsis rubida]
MNLLRAERIKLFSTRAPWWCALIAVAAPIAFTALFLGLSGAEITADVSNTQLATSTGRTVALVLAVLAATADFSWGTLRLTFQAVPTRTPALLAKGTVVLAVCAVLGLLAGVGSWGLAHLVRPDADLGLHSGADWRIVFGQILTFALTGLLGVGVGLLLRSSALALAIVLVWTQLVEGLVLLIPKIGGDLYQWMPFYAASQFAGGDFTRTTLKLSPPFGPWGYLAYFAAISVVLFAAGVATANRRDA